MDHLLRQSIVHIESTSGVQHVFSVCGLILVHGHQADVDGAFYTGPCPGVMTTTTRVWTCICRLPFDRRHLGSRTREKFSSKGLHGDRPPCRRYIEINARLCRCEMWSSLTTPSANKWSMTVVIRCKEFVKVMTCISSLFTRGGKPAGQKPI